ALLCPLARRHPALRTNGQHRPTRLWRRPQIVPAAAATVPPNPPRRPPPPADEQRGATGRPCAGDEGEEPEREGDEACRPRQKRPLLLEDVPPNRPPAVLAFSGRQIRRPRKLSPPPA